MEGKRVEVGQFWKKRGGEGEEGREKEGSGEIGVGVERRIGSEKYKHVALRARSQFPPTPRAS
jgi:hypothetical protein